MQIKKLIEEEQPSAKNSVTTQSRKKEILLVPMPDAVPDILD